jgi:beta-lactam-binding protein with PASTA domain
MIRAILLTSAVALMTCAATHAQPSVVKGPAAKVVVPNVVGFRMDRATRTLHTRGLRVNEECSGIFGCIIKPRWWVCVQTPRAGQRVPEYSVVVIYAERRGEC